VTVHEITLPTVTQHNTSTRNIKLHNALSFFITEAKKAALLKNITFNRKSFFIKDTAFKQGIVFKQIFSRSKKIKNTVSLSDYIMPPMPPIPPMSGIAAAPSSAGASATIASVVIIKPAIEAAA
jgi:hypothetical protein